MNTFNITLDLNKSNVTTPIRLRQGDLDGTTITALILDHGATADLTGLSARFVMELPGGEHYYRKDATVGEGSVTVTINEEQAASVTGRTTRAYFQLLDGETVRASTGSVTVDILPDALEGHTVPADYDSAIQDAIDALDDAVENIADTVEDVLEDHPEWTTTVQDGAVTDAKLYQGTDGILARNARLMYRLDNLLANALPEGDSATATDAAKTPLAGLALYGRSTQDGTPTPSSPVSIVSVEGDSEGNISLWARGKNLATITNRPATSNGINFTYNADGSVTLSGTATAQSVIWLNSQALNLTAGTYTMSVSGLQTGVVVQFAHQMESGGSITYDYGSSSGPSATFAIPSGCYMNDFRFVISNGATVNTTVYVQIEYGSTAHDYQPYVETVTPIDLDGHELRSLPDGTRDELTVGADGRVTLVQRVGHSVFDGSSDEVWSVENNGARINVDVPDIKLASSNNEVFVGVCNRFGGLTPNQTWNGTLAGVSGNMTAYKLEFSNGTKAMTASGWAAWLANHPVTVLYPLENTVTHDLGTVDPVPLVGPDLTAQAVPSAPFALTYERDLNVTLARLEAAIAALA